MNKSFYETLRDDNRWNHLIDTSNLLALWDCMECGVAPSPELAEWFMESRLKFKFAGRQHEWGWLLQFIAMTNPEVVEAYLDLLVSDEAANKLAITVEHCHGIMKVILADSVLVSLLDSL